MSTASFSVVVPATGAGAATPQSLVVSLVQVNGAAPTLRVAPFTMNLNLATPACVSQPGVGFSCTALVPAPYGTDTFALTTYAGPNGTGAQIATSQAKALVAAGGATPCPSSAPSAPGTPIGHAI